MIFQVKSLILRILQYLHIMKKLLLSCAVLFLFSLNVNAQFVDDMEWVPGNCPSHWGITWCPLISTTNAHSGLQSGHIPNDGITDTVLDLGSKTTGEWGLEFWMFIPSGGVGYFNLQGVYQLALENGLLEIFSLDSL